MIIQRQILKRFPFRQHQKCHNKEDIQLVDVRTVEEYADFHLKKSKLIPHLFCTKIFI